MTIQPLVISRLTGQVAGLAPLVSLDDACEALALLDIDHGPVHLALGCAWTTAAPRELPKLTGQDTHVELRGVVLVRQAPTGPARRKSPAAGCRCPACATAQGLAPVTSTVPISEVAVAALGWGESPPIGVELTRRNELTWMVTGDAIALGAAGEVARIAGASRASYDRGRELEGDLEGDGGRGRPRSCDRCWTRGRDRHEPRSL